MLLQIKLYHTLNSNIDISRHSLEIFLTGLTDPRKDHFKGHLVSTFAEMIYVKKKKKLILPPVKNMVAMALYFNAPVKLQSVAMRGGNLSFGVFPSFQI